MEAKLFNQTGAEIGTIEVNETIFGIEPNVPVMHQYVVMQLANARQGTQSTLGRGDVRGSTRKIYRQKGTGRARQGSIRAPHRPGGGIAHGPHPRKYTKHMPRKMRRLAVRSALSAKFAAEELRFIDALHLDAPRTKDMLAILKAHSLEGKVLIVLDAKSETTLTLQRSANNLPNVKTLWASYLNVRDLLHHDVVLMPQAAVSVVEGYLTPANAAAGEEA